MTTEHNTDEWTDRKVTVVTRTKDRPIMLPRVLQSLRGQTTRDFVWVLVNDAGQPQAVDDIAIQARALGIETIVVHREVSIGMEAASNDGMRRTQTPYAVIHDDDDTWEPDFLATTIEHLEAHPEAGGVICWSTRVDEVLHPRYVEVVNRYPYNHGMLGVYLADMAVTNRFPPISFLFTREIYDKVGGFDESLPVLGDWDFSLRVLLEADIHVLPVALANYHFRVGHLGDAQYGNSVTHQGHQHAFHDVAYHNRKLREDIYSGRIGLGFLLAEGFARRPDRADRLLARLHEASLTSKSLGALRRALKL